MSFLKEEEMFKIFHPVCVLAYLILGNAHGYKNIKISTTRISPLASLMGVEFW